MTKPIYEQGSYHKAFNGDLFFITYKTDPGDGPQMLGVRQSDGAVCAFWSDGMFQPLSRDRCNNDLAYDLEPPMPAAQQKAEPGWKMDAGKARIDLVAPEFVTATADVLAFGAAKYSERNWERGMSWGRCFGALMRHMWAWWGGERNDPESGLPHLAHAACCLMFLTAYEARSVGTDDRKLTLDKSE